MSRSGKDSHIIIEQGHVMRNLKPPPTSKRPPPPEAQAVRREAVERDPISVKESRPVVISVAGDSKRVVTINANGRIHRFT